MRPRAHAERANILREAIGRDAAHALSTSATTQLHDVDGTNDTKLARPGSHITNADYQASDTDRQRYDRPSRTCSSDGRSVRTSARARYRSCPQQRTRVIMNSVIETSEYEQWLANFPPQYHSTAEFMIGSLRYLDDSTFRSQLSQQILERFTNEDIEPPALMIPIRTGTEMGWGGPGPAVMFDNVFPNQGIRVPNTGSEAICANIIRNLEKGRQREALGTVSVPRSLDDMRRGRVRSIVLVGDYAGSGSQASEAARIWTRNRSIRSWRSYHRIRIHVILHSASVAAMKSLKTERSIDRLSTVSVAPDFDNVGWTSEQRTEVSQFCERFARYRDRALGWEGSAGLLVMQHTAPNNLPMVLWQTKGASRRRDGWYPLFPERRIPENLTAALASQSLQRIQLREDDTPASTLVLSPPFPIVLDALQRGARTVERISALANVSLTSAAEVLAALTDGGYIDERGYLTDAGRRLVEPSIRPINRYRLNGSTEPYYPQALRTSR